MVLIIDKKYACETCIKGHRSSACKHTDRPLFEIKKKGRPVTQCEHCRELRKTKQVHVKCICGSREGTNNKTDAPSTSKKANKVPASATFPNGLPEALEASVALQLLSEGSSDSDPTSDRFHPCSCKEGGDCHCCIPRKSAPKKKKTGSSQPNEDGVANHNTKSTARLPSGSSSHPSLSVLARVAELRPVLPRPVTMGAAPHMPSGSLHGTRHHSHENILFSPYGRAYEQNHSESMYARSESSASDQQNHEYLEIPFPSDPNTFSLPPLPIENSNGTGEQSWPLADGSFPSLCGCGDTCSCPGCSQHSTAVNNVSDPSIYNQCTNPGACSFCLDCSILSLPSDLPPNTALSIYDSSQSQSIDEWIRQVSALPPANNASLRPPPSFHQHPSLSMTPATAWDGYQVPRISEPPPPPLSDSDHCNGRCKCPPGLCTCEPGCCGCCQGCECEEDRMTTFATSGERQSCCSGKTHEVSGVEYPAGSGPSRSAAPLVDSSRNFLSVNPNMMRSRASSISSQSSQPSSRISGSSSGRGLDTQKGVSLSSATAPQRGSCCSSKTIPTVNHRLAPMTYFDGGKRPSSRSAQPEFRQDNSTADEMQML